MKTNHNTNNTTFLKFILVFCLLAILACKKEENQIVSQTTNQITANQALDIFPHSEEFKHSTLHGSLFLQNRASCSKCHGNDFKGGSTGVACTSCHNYPHDSTWAQPQNHGTHFAKLLADQADTIPDQLKRNVTECMMCHENKINPKGTFKERHPQQYVACASCHADMPHGQKFLPTLPTDKGPIAHRTYLKAHPELKGSCFSCHLNTKRAAPKPVDKCLECHQYEPPFDDTPAPAPEPTPTPTPTP